MNNTPHALSIPEMTLLASLGNPQTCQVRSLASDIQNTLVPPLTYQTAHLEAHGQSLPKDDVGGDLVDLLADGRDVIAYVADVSGHGLRAGVLMGMIKTAVRYGLLLRQPVAKLLGDINRVLPALKQPNMFATLAALRFDGSNEVEYISAGHVPLLHYRHRNKDVIRYSNSQFPLGLFDSAYFVTQRIPCEPGDIFALITDGVLEVGPDHDADLGSERLAEILHQFPARPLSRLSKRSTAISNSMDRGKTIRRFCWCERLIRTLRRPIIRTPRTTRVSAAPSPSKPDGSSCSTISPQS